MVATKQGHLDITGERYIPVQGLPDECGFRGMAIAGDLCDLCHHGLRKPEQKCGHGFHQGTPFVKDLTLDITRIYISGNVAPSHKLAYKGPGVPGFTGGSVGEVSVFAKW